MLAARKAFESHDQLPEEERGRRGIWLAKGNRGYDEPSGGYDYHQSRIEIEISSISRLIISND